MAKNKFYAFPKTYEGKMGIYDNWNECESLTRFPGRKYRGWPTYEEALAYYKENGGPEDGVNLNREDWMANGAAKPLKAAAKNAAKNKEVAKTEAAVDYDGIFNEDKEKKYLLKADSAAPVSQRVDDFCQRYNKFNMLSAEQKKAVQQVNGKVLLFAVPGSGKTTVIMARTAYMIHACGIEPAKLMSLTFTKAAAMEMSERYKKLFPHEPAHRLPNFRTIHSFCWSIALPRLREAGYACPFRLVNTTFTEEDEEGEVKNKYVSQTNLLKKAIKTAVGKENIRTTDKTLLDKALSVITSIKNRMLVEADYEDKFVNLDNTEVSVKKLYDAYEAERNAKQVVDFDDMLKLTLKGLQEFPEVLAALQAKYTYWSIDEAQDNCRLQYELLKLLVGEQGNLFMVGDDDQSIYGFRGAEPKMLLDYGNSDKVCSLVMGTNYRSDTKIVNCAKAFIESNEVRADKQMRPYSKAEGNIRFVENLPTVDHQYAYILKAAEECLDKKQKLAVLYRMNSSVLPLLFLFKKHNLPFYMSKSYAEVLQDKIFNDVISIIRFALQPNSVALYKKCKYCLDMHIKDAKRLEAKPKNMPVLDYMLSLMEGQDNLGHVQNTKAFLESLVNQPPRLAVKLIFTNTNFKVLKNNPGVGDKLRISVMLSIAAMYDSLEAWVHDVEAMLQEAKKSEDEEQPNQEIGEELIEDDDCWSEQEKKLITFSTMHSSKGLEFDRVIIIDSLADVMDAVYEYKPNEFAFQDFEEETRLFYVAVTRAMHELDILSVANYNGILLDSSKLINYLRFAYSNIGYQEEELEQFDKPAVATEAKEADSVPYGGTFYGVKGPNAGVYTSWKDVEKACKGVKGSSNHKFTSREEAEKYAFGDTPVSKPTELKYTYLQSVMQAPGEKRFNRPMDLPQSVHQSVLEVVGVKALRDLTKAEIKKLKADSDCFREDKEVDYSDITKYYVLNYLPVNFYKSWLPLWKLLVQKKLKHKLKVLELGAGPGTATLGLVYFYIKLAEENSGIDFALDISIVERVSQFIEAFKTMTGNVQKCLPSNLQLTINEPIKEDAFDFMAGIKEPQYDLILESNLLNPCEGIDMQAKEKLAKYSMGLGNGLQEDGLALFIEPGKRDEKVFLNTFTIKLCQCGLSTVLSPDIRPVDVSGIGLLQGCLNIGLRYKRIDEHWFSYVVIEK